MVASAPTFKPTVEAAGPQLASGGRFRRSMYRHRMKMGTPTGEAGAGPRALVTGDRRHGL
jgi:hypothetical protein